MSIRVLVVDDSVVVRRLVTRVLDAAPGIEVVGTAATGRAALARVAQLEPDLVTMDVEMPEMDGITAVRELRRAGWRMPVVMFSTLTERGAAATVEALTAGASDYVAKPTGSAGLEAALARVGAELVPKVRALCARATSLGASRPGRAAAAGSAPAGAPRAAVAGAAAAGASRPTALAEAPAASRLRPRPVRTSPVRAVVVGSSTGGPAALATVVAALTAPPPVPVLVTQHMPALFTRQLAERLDRAGLAAVSEASAGQVLTAGHVYVAPGGRHLEVERSGNALLARLTDDPPVNYCRPSVDVLFRSAVLALGGALLAVVLTGMGADGAAGAGQIADAGGLVLAQDEPTSVVWGMPGAVATGGHAHEVLPLEGIAPALEAALREGRS